MAHASAPSCAAPAAGWNCPPAALRAHAAAHAAACSAWCRAVLSGRLPTELSHRECVELLGTVAAVIASHALADDAGDASPTHSPTPSRARPPPCSAAALHDETTASVALVAVAVRMDDLDTLLRCVRAGTSGPRLLFGSPGLAADCWDRLWRCAAASGHTRASAGTTAQAQPSASVKRLGRLGAKFAPGGVLAAGAPAGPPG
eukprot:scaffold30664_cov79-Isochrysis_galbana.AAC.1